MLRRSPRLSVASSQASRGGRFFLRCACSGSKRGSQPVRAGQGFTLWGEFTRVSRWGDILAAFQLTCLSFAAGELVSPYGPRRGVALRLKRSPDACLPNLCQHQGDCQVMEDGPVCSCKPGFTGAFCQGRAEDAGEPSPVCPQAPEGRVMGMVHWCYHCSSLQAPGACPSSWFTCIPHHHHHVLTTCWHKT